MKERTDAAPEAFLQALVAQLRDGKPDGIGRRRDPERVRR